MGGMDGEGRGGGEGEGRGRRRGGGEGRRRGGIRRDTDVDTPDHGLSVISRSNAKIFCPLLGGGGVP